MIFRRTLRSLRIGMRKTRFPHFTLLVISSLDAAADRATPRPPARQRQVRRGYQDPHR